MSNEIGDRFLVTGACTHTGCGKFTKITIGNKEDAQDMINHDHGCEYGHCFVGEFTISERSAPKLVEEAA